MNDIQMIEAVEKYIMGEMNPDERLYFEQLRKTNPEIDQLVVEHTLFLQQMNRFGEWKQFKSALHETHIDLAEKNQINSDKLQGKAKVVYLWNRYKRVASIAAIIAGVTTLSVVAITNLLLPKADNSQLTELKGKYNDLVENAKEVTKDLNEVKKSIIKQKIQPGTAIIDGGTGFMIDAKGYLVTNAHVVKNGKSIVVENNKGEQFVAEIVKLDAVKDIAILKINDKDFKPLGTLPYSIKKSSTDVAERIFTLGFPRNDVVYSEGYLSAKTGFNGDTLSCQLGIAVNPGNSGGPVFNNRGEVVGILSTKEKQAEGVAFAIQSKYIHQAIDELKKDTAYRNLKTNPYSSIGNLERTQQFNRIKDYVFLIKNYTAK
jgi:serine protease Do